MSRRAILLVAAAALGLAAPARADFMDLFLPGGITPGAGGGFSGTLDGVGVTGAFVGPHAVAAVVPSPTAVIGFSTVDNGSPQHSIFPPFYPTKAGSDRVGYEAVAIGATTVTVTFAAPMRDLVIHVSHLDTSFLEFAPSVPLGLTGMAVLASNGGADGLAIGGGSGLQIFDLDPTTIDFVPNTAPPPLAGARSGYGSVQLFGVYTTLRFDIVHPVAAIDNATFTFSSVPEPGTLLLFGLTGLSAAGWARYRRNRPQA